VRGLTFELTWRQRRGARPRPQKMYTVPVAGAWWHAVGAQVERGVRRLSHRLEAKATLPSLVIELLTRGELL